MGTEVNCSIEECRYQFDGTCTRGKIDIYLRQVTLNYPVATCKTYLEEREVDDGRQRVD